MEKNLSTLFNTTTGPELPAGFEERVFERIGQAAAVRERTLRYTWGIFSLASLSAFILSGMYAVQAFSSSNFGTYFSLIFSDGSSIALWWRELGLSLVESLPVVGVGIFLASIAVLLWSVRKFSKHYGSARFITPHAVQTA